MVEHPKQTRMVDDVRSCFFQCTDVVLKVSAPPRLLVLDLYAEVDPTKTSALVAADSVTFQLHKVRMGRGTLMRAASCIQPTNQHLAGTCTPAYVCDPCTYPTRPRSNEAGCCRHPQKTPGLWP